MSPTFDQDGFSSPPPGPFPAMDPAAPPELLRELDGPYAPGRAPAHGTLGQESPNAFLDRLVDAVVERIEDRVVDELERRGRQEWRVI
jgi:hypothetical protein